MSRTDVRGVVVRFADGAAIRYVDGHVVHLPEDYDGPVHIESSSNSPSTEEGPVEIPVY